MMAKSNRSFWKEMFDPREWDRPTQTYALQMSIFAIVLIPIILLLMQG